MFTARARAAENWLRLGRGLLSSGTSGQEHTGSVSLFFGCLRDLIPELGQEFTLLDVSPQLASQNSYVAECMASEGCSECTWNPGMAGSSHNAATLTLYKSEAFVVSLKVL